MLGYEVLKDGVPDSSGRLHIELRCHSSVQDDLGNNR